MFGGKITRVSINICTTMENKRREAWTHEETVLLIELWDDQRVKIDLKRLYLPKIDLFRTDLTQDQSKFASVNRVLSKIPEQIPDRQNKFSYEIFSRN
jgi:hypothetical protein